MGKTCPNDINYRQADDNMTKVIILADVDGQFNDFDTPAFDNATGESLRDHLTAFEAENGFTIRFDKTVLDRVVELHTSGRAEVQWLTTWNHDANAMLRAQFGFPEDLHVADGDWSGQIAPLSLQDRHSFLRQMHKGTWWKALVAHVTLAENPDARVIWLDDDFPYYKGSTAWAEPYVESGRLMMVETWPSLSHQDLDVIDDFINDLAS